MSIELYLKRVEGGLEKKFASVWGQLTTFGSKAMSGLENFFTVLVPEEVEALKPFAAEALTEAADAVPALIAGLVSGNPFAGLTAYATALVPVIVATAKKAEAAGLSVAGAAVSTAVHAVIADAASNQATPVTVEPVSVAPPVEPSPAVA